VWDRTRRVGAGSCSCRARGAIFVHVFVLGLDPGLTRCGYCVLRVPDGSGGRADAVALGVLRTSPADPLHERLGEFQRELRSLMAEHPPAVLAIERVLFQVNVSTAMSVSQVSGIAMAEAANAGCEVVQYSPNEVKSAVAGWGGADKVQMQQMVQTLLGLRELPQPADAADAAALALCHVAMAPMHTAIAGRPR
jgi:crossover junction endodeoxyribonuclease RuvC